MSGIPVAEPTRGDVLDRRYRLIDRLGRGGFGDVWRAEELLPDGVPFREVALKLLTGGFNDVAHWGEEAKLLASFRHPSLVTIYAAGVFGEDGATRPLPYVAMELLLGETLAERMREEGRVPWRRVVAWARDAAAALDVIHARGVVHLDLKPANLFVERDGSIKVLDFGIARRAGVPASLRERAIVTVPSVDAHAQTAIFLSTDEALAVTHRSDRSSRAVIGTPGFIAPEVLDLEEPTAATDAWSLAVCVAYLVTGRLPQSVADEPQILDPGVVSAWWEALRAATMHGTMRDLAADPARMPRGLVRLLERLLAVDPFARRVQAGALRALFDEVWERPYGAPARPYPGLAAIGPEGEGAIFGRDEDLERLGRELSYEPCLVLGGGHGVGKTSLAVAGVVPRLARRFADGKDDWRAVRVAPGDDPDAALEAALAQANPVLAGVSCEALEAWAAHAREGLVLVVDPLEDLLTAPEGRRARTWELVAALAGARTKPGLRLLATIGDDEGRALASAGAVGAALRSSLRFVGPPPKTSARGLVTGPAHLVHAEIVGADDVVAEVGRELGGEGTRLPFVALALAAWWDAREHDAAGRAVLRGSTFRRLGGVAGAVAAHADAELARLPAPDRAIAEAAFLRLGTTEGAPLGWVDADLAVAIGADPAALDAVIGTLAAAHLVRRREGSVEVAHASLLVAWPQLTSLRLADMDRLAFLERLREAAGAWDRSGGHPDLLWHGAPLAELADRAAWLARGISDREADFVRECRRRSRGRRIGRAAAAGVVVALVAGAFAASAVMDAREGQALRERDAARRRAQLAELSTAARRSEDPFHRVAFAAAAIEAQADALAPADGTLPLELARAASRLPRARFLTLDPVSGPAFPWGERWLVASSLGGLTVVDLAPPDPEVFDGVDIDAAYDSEPAPPKEPRTIRFSPHAAPIVERAPFAFDTALATRSAAGEVKVVRLREDGTVALAATAPFRCTGALHVAAAAPVLACPSDEGVVRWDLALAHAPSPGARAVERFAGAGDVLDVSPDGARVAIGRGRQVVVWAPATGRTTTFHAEEPPLVARFAPTENALAIVEPARVSVVDPDRAGALLFRFAIDAAAVDARWDAGGLDLAVCDAHGRGRFTYLRPGGRAKDDPAPRGPACDLGLHRVEAGERAANGRAGAIAAGPGAIEAVDEAPGLAGRDVGLRGGAGGFRLADGRVVTHDLVLIDAAAAPAGGLLRFAGRSELGGPDPRGDLESVAAVVRASPDLVAFQVGGEVRVYSVSTGRRALARPGMLLRRCADGRVLGYQRAGATWVVFDALSQRATVSLPRDAALVIGADAACRVLYTQRLDGTLAATPLADGGTPRPIARADGFAYESRPIPARGAEGTGLLLAFSSGAVARIDDETGAVQRLAYATPRATAIGPGPGPGEVIFADETGVTLLGADGSSQRVADATPALPWDDLALAPDGASVLLASAERAVVLDLARKELMGSIPLVGRSRFASWDDEGSVLAWSFDRVGGAEGEVVPRGRTLVRQVAEAVSNLRVKDGKLGLR